MREITKTARFVVNGERIELELARYEDDRFAVTATADGHAGQCESTVREIAGHVPDVRLVLTAWDSYHLKVAPESVFADVTSALERLDGRHIGEAPDIDEAPDIGGMYIDSRDVIKRLEIYRQAVIGLGVKEEDVDSFDNESNWPDYMPESLDDESDEIIREFLDLRQLDEEGSSAAPDWKYGETMIRESDFEEYAREFASDIGAINEDASWPNSYIDWEKATEALKMNYSEVEYGETTYLIR